MKVGKEEVTSSQKNCLKIMEALAKNPRGQLRKMGMPVSTAHEVMNRVLKKVKYEVVITKKRGMKKIEIPKGVTTKNQEGVNPLREFLLVELNKNPRASNQEMAPKMEISRSCFYRRLRILKKSYNIRLRWIQEDKPMEAESMDGEKIDLKELKEYSGWKAFKDKVHLISKDGTKFVATVNVDTLIDCWIEKEIEAYEESTQ